MPNQNDKALTLAKLHVKGEPIIIFNAWDGGSAKAIAEAGAKAIATTDHGVAAAHGYGDDELTEFSFEGYFVTIKEIVKAAGDLPVSVDINNGADLTMEQLQDRIRALLEAGVVGINFEDRLPDSSGVLPIADQVLKIEAIRAAADDFGVDLFINARSDLFSTTKDDPNSLLGEAAMRAEAYQSAGGNSFFVPGLMDIELITRLCSDVELPVNIIRLPGAPATKDLAAAGVARVSHGPIPQMRMIEWLKGQATVALKGDE